MNKPRIASAWLLRTLAILALFVSGIACAEVPVPPLKARVTDLTATLSPGQQASLEETLRAFEARKGSQIAVLIVPTTKPEAIEQYSIRVVEQWKLGRKKTDDGALLLVAKDDRKVRIEVGYGLEGVLTDAATKRIIEEEIVPRFRRDDFTGGINAGVARMIQVIDGETLPPPMGRSPEHRDRQSQSVGGDNDRLVTEIVLLFVGILVFLIAALFADLTSAIVSLVIGLVAGVLVVSTISALSSILFGVGASIFALYKLGGRRRARGGRDAGGSWSSGSSDSGGFFSGGGGLFGGGGASGDWGD